jgi:hypothetical protein
MNQAYRKAKIRIPRLGADGHPSGAPDLDAQLDRQVRR